MVRKNRTPSQSFDAQVGWQEFLSS